LVKESGKVSTTINLNDADNLMDIDHVNTCEVSTGALDRSHASGGASKRSFEMAKVADEVDEEPEHKKIKLDNVVSMNSGSCENAYNGRLSSKVHPLSASSLNDGTSNKLMAGSSSSDGKCVFPLDLNAVDDENIINIPSSDDEELPDPVPLQVGKQTKGDLSLSLAFPSGKELGSKPQFEPQRRLPERSNRNNTSSIWGQQIWRVALAFLMSFARRQIVEAPVHHKMNHPEDHCPETDALAILPCLQC